MAHHYKSHIRRGDNVRVIAGNHKGASGLVLSVNPKSQTAVVENINMLTHYIKMQDKEQSDKAGIVRKPGPIHISNLAFLDPKTKEATRIGRKQDDKGALRRYAKKTGNFI